MKKMEFASSSNVMDNFSEISTTIFSTLREFQNFETFFLQFQQLFSDKFYIFLNF